MNKTIRKFIDYLEVEKGYSKYTINNYEKDILFFLEFLKNEEIYSFKEVEHLTLRNYLNLLSQKHYSNKTISRNLSSLRALFKFLLKEEYIN